MSSCPPYSNKGCTTTRTTNCFTVPLLDVPCDFGVSGKHHSSGMDSHNNTTTTSGGGGGSNSRLLYWSHAAELGLLDAPPTSGGGGGGIEAPCYVTQQRRGVANFTIAANSTAFDTFQQLFRTMRSVFGISEHGGEDYGAAVEGGSVFREDPSPSASLMMGLSAIMSKSAWEWAQCPVVLRQKIVAFQSASRGLPSGAVLRRLEMDHTKRCITGDSTSVPIKHMLAFPFYVQWVLSPLFCCENDCGWTSRVARRLIAEEHR